MTVKLNNLKGFKARAVSVRHLPELKEDLRKFLRPGLVDKKLEETYLKFNYEVSAALPGVLSLIVLAVPQPLTRLTFLWRGRPHAADIPPTYIGRVDDAGATDTLEKLLAPAGYKLTRARLPVKTLAVRSGLARYGRNNIAYVPGYGSYHRLLAFVTDAPLEDSWSDLEMMEDCADCSRCAQACPTHCIPADRFLIHAENCLTFHNESPAVFPDWIRPEWHNALVGCMRCQFACPVNKNRLNIAEGPVFSELETGLLLQKPPMENLDDQTRLKLKTVEMDDYYEVLNRNLDALLTG